MAICNANQDFPILGNAAIMHIPSGRIFSIAQLIGTSSEKNMSSPVIISSLCFLGGVGLLKAMSSNSSEPSQRFGGGSCSGSFNL